MKTYKTFLEDKTLKDIVKREKESSYSGSNTSKSIRTMTKQIKREKSDDVIIVHLSDDGDSVMLLSLTQDLGPRHPPTSRRRAGIF